MLLAVTIEINQQTVGMIALMLVLAVSAALVAYAVTGILAFMGMDGGSIVDKAAAILHWPLTVIAFLGGGWLGYVLMS